MRPQTFKELIIDSFEPVQSEIKWRLQTWLEVLWKKVTNYKLDSNEERFSAPKQGIKKNLVRYEEIYVKENPRRTTRYHISKPENLIV